MKFNGRKVLGRKVATEGKTEAGAPSKGFSLAKVGFRFHLSACHQK